MRLTFTACMRRVLLLIVPLFLCTILFANDSQDGEKITLFEKATPLKTVFKKITFQTGIKFVYSNRLVDDEQKVDVSVKNASLEEVMQQLFFGKKFELQRTSPKSVVLIVHEKSVSAVAPAAVSNDVAVIDVTGTVSDVTGEKLPGATVLVRGTNKATMTDGEGRFRLAAVLANAKLLVSYTGYEAEEIKLQGQRELNVKLQRGENRLNEVVVAYGTTSQRANTGALTVVRGDQIRTLPNRSFDKSLQGLVPGLQITNGTGQPGGGVSSMIQRGISSGADPLSGTTARNPLILIDGIPVSQESFQRTMSAGGTPISNPLAQLNPSDIESISVLKDAAAISLYGSKASNGVILVTTKKGKVGTSVLSFRSQMDFAYLPNRNLSSMLNQEQYLKLLYDTYKATNPTLWTDNEIRKDLFKKFPYRVSRTDTSFYPASDWAAALTKNAATTFSNEVSLSGGNEKSTFYLSFEYTKQNGIVKRTDYDRKAFRVNFENKPKNWLTVGTNTTFSYNVQNFTNLTESAASTFGAISYMSPLNPIRNEKGDLILLYPWGGPTSPVSDNPLGRLEYDISRNVSYRGLSKVYGEASFLKYFKFRSSVGIDFMLSEVTEKVDPRFRQGTRNTGSISSRNIRRSSIINNNILSFSMPIQKKHDIGVILGHEAQIITDGTLFGEAKGDTTALPIYDQISSPGYIMTTLYGRNNRQTLLSLFGQFNYGYKEKYFLTSSIRRDASSRFGSRELWGTYWSVGGGWIISEESFFGKSNYLNYLKLRGSFGVSGNSGAVDPATKFDLLQQTLYNGQTAITANYSPGNQDIKWERTFSNNIGLDARLVKGRLSVTADIYNKKTKNLIYQVDLPSVSGFSYVNSNIGDLKNRGIEVSISGNIIEREGLRWNMGISWSRNENILSKAYVPFVVLATGNIANEVGRNFNSFFLPVWAGVNPADGKPMWIDSTGKATSVYSKAKKEFVGKPQPDAFGTISSSFTYKNLELSIRLYYQYGSKVLSTRLYSLMSDGASPYLNQTTSSLNYWKKPGDIAENPRRILNNTDGGRLPSTRYLLDGDYLKLSNIILTYNFPIRHMKRAGIKLLKAYIQGNDLAIWTKVSDQDPDNANMIGVMSTPYPNSKGFSVGLQANF